MNSVNMDNVWQLERPEIAWGTIALFLIYISGYGLVITLTLSESIPFVATTFICTCLAYMGFTIIHDAGHGSIFRESSKLKPLERAMGWVAGVPLMLVPFNLFKIIHDRHHAYTNDPELDPDHFIWHKSWYGVLLNCLYIPMQYHILSVTKLAHDKKVRQTYPTTLFYFSVIIISLILLIQLGFMTELIFLVFIPNVLAVIMLALFFDYIPHYPHKSLNRYNNARIYPSRILNILLLGQNYHLTHHLYPKVPWYKYRTLYLRIKSDLAEHNAPIEKVFSTKEFPEQYKTGTSTIEQLLRSPKTLTLMPDSGKLNMVLTISNIEKLTDDAIEISFDLPQNQSLDFISGQYLTLTKWLHGVKYTRSYSISSLPKHSPLTIAVRDTGAGGMSSYLNKQLAIGEEITVNGPFGNFIFPPTPTELNENTVIKGKAKNKATLVLFAAGSGITPILSILKSALAGKLFTKIKLIYCNKCITSTMYLAELRRLQQRYATPLTIELIISQKTSQQFNDITLINARMNETLCHSIMPEYDDSNLYYLCGPKPLQSMVTDTLQQLGVAPESIHCEQFIPEQIKPQGECYQVTINLISNQTKTISVAENQNVLSIAQQQGINMSYACSTGYCGSCKCKVVSGKTAELPISASGISPDEIEQGYTLACQCKPLGDLTLLEVD